MTPAKFIKEANELFSAESLYRIPHERPEVVASKKLNRKFKAFLKSQFPNAELIGFSGGFCQSSGFIKQDNKFVYVGISDIRYWKNWASDVLIRTADNEKDYHGHMNHRTTISDLKKAVEVLFDRYDIEARYKI